MLDGMDEDNRHYGKAAQNIRDIHSRVMQRRCVSCLGLCHNWLYTAKNSKQKYKKNRDRTNPSPGNNLGSPPARTQPSLPPQTNCLLL